MKVTAESNIECVAILDGKASKTGLISVLKKIYAGHRVKILVLPKEE